MMTQKELYDEFWLLTKGILQDSRLDTTEANVVRRWLEEHQRGDEFAPVIERLDAFLRDGFIDQFESRHLVNSLGRVLQTLNVSQGV